MASVVTGSSPALWRIRPPNELSVQPKPPCRGRCRRGALALGTIKGKARRSGYQSRQQNVELFDPKLKRMKQRVSRGHEVQNVRSAGKPRRIKVKYVAATGSKGRVESECISGVGRS